MYLSIAKIDCPQGWVDSHEHLEVFNLVYCETVCPVKGRLKYIVMVLLMVPLLDNQEHALINILV